EDLDGRALGINGRGVDRAPSPEQESTAVSQPDRPAATALERDFPGVPSARGHAEDRSIGGVPIVKENFIPAAPGGFAVPRDRGCDRPGRATLNRDALQLEVRPE